MQVKSYEKGKFKLYLTHSIIARDLFAVIYLNGNHSQLIETRDMDYETATDIFDMLVEPQIEPALVQKEEKLPDAVQGFLNALRKSMGK